MHKNRTKSVRRQMARFDQMGWETAVKFHAIYKRWLTETNPGPTIKEFCERKIASLEAQYPQLKK
jgi:hypothetical protein